jgi:hypothetical protein
MEPFPLNAIAVQWRFRCDGEQAQGGRWDWHCQSPEGVVVARSHGAFNTLHDAVADANKHGFGYEVKTEDR